MALVSSTSAASFSASRLEPPRAAIRLRCQPDHLVVVHDEMDLPPGKLKVKIGGGLAGNNGLKSIKAHLKTDDFVRVRVGIGKPPGRQQGVGHVLRRPGKAEQAELDVAMAEAADAVEAILADGAEMAQTRFNARS